MIRPLLPSLGLMLAALSLPALAGDSRNGLCDYELDYDIALETDGVHLDRPGERWRLSGDRLYRQDREVVLSATERRQLVELREHIEQLVPEVSRVASEGAMLGVEAVSLVLSSLGDEDDAVRISTRLATLGARVRGHFDGRHLPRGDLEDGLGDATLEAEIEALAADAALEMGGGIAGFVFSALFDPARAEAKGERIERLVERRIEPRAEALEQRAEALCREIRHVDTLEGRLARFELLRRSGPET